MRAELAGPVRHFVTLHSIPEPRAAERQIDEHADLALLRERKDALLGAQVVHGVVDADEIAAFRLAHEALERVVLALEGGRRADVTNASLLLEIAQYGKLRREIGHV